MAPISVLVSGLALLQVISGTFASNFLTSCPSQINGKITACVGEEISLTCSHDNALSATTTWTVSPPVNCSRDITHNPPTPIAPPCGPFSFQNITLAEIGTIQLNSTAMATASNEINSSIIECIAGFIPSVSVGIISVCVIDELPAPVNLRCMEVLRGLSVSWDVITDGNRSCARSSFAYDVTLVGEDNRTIASMNDVKDTHIEITDSSLEPSQNYTIYVRARLVQGTCEAREAATVVCRTSDDPSPTIAPVATDTTTEDSAPSTSSARSITPVVVAVVVVVVVITTVIGVIIAVILVMIYKHKQNKITTNTERARVDYPQNSDPLYTEVLDTKTDSEIDTQLNVAYLDIKSTRSQRVNRNAGASVSTERNAVVDTANDGRLYAEIHEADDKLANIIEIPVNKNVAYIDLKHIS